VTRTRDSLNRRRDNLLTFVTPYWSGRDMMKIHLASIRQFYPTAPILISKRGGGSAEMEEYRAEYRVEYWLEECDYTDALLRLLKRCETEYVCVLEHDTVLLSSLDHLLSGLRERRWDVVGMEERVRDSPDTNPARLPPPRHGWLRFAPGQLAGPMLLFNLQGFRRRWGLAGIRGKRPYGAWDYEYDFGIGQKLVRHKYLLPFHTRKYGMGNLLKDGDTAVAWHQWYGSYRSRLAEAEADNAYGREELVEQARRGEAAFLADYPNLDLFVLIPAWGPDCDIAGEQQAAEAAFPPLPVRVAARFRRWSRLGARVLLARALARLDRWRRVW
jgi:hypothetical protein